jgi:Kef-type K+ transport system membrane component KefB
MKTYLVYGFAMALAGALLMLALFFLGFHSDPTKAEPAQWIGMLLGLTISATCIVLGTKARRAELPANEPFGYGSALAAGVMITLVASLFGIATNYLYFQVINPGFEDVIIQAEIAKMEDKGMSAQQVEAAENLLRKIMSPVFQAVWGFVIGMIMGTVISLISAAFLKREAHYQPPLVA